MYFLLMYYIIILSLYFSGPQKEVACGPEHENYCLNGGNCSKYVSLNQTFCTYVSLDSKIRNYLPHEVRLMYQHMY